MRVKSYTEAVRLANAAGMDAANRRMRKAGRKAWTLEDHNHACRVVEDFLVKLGYDVRSWNALAGLPRNEPEPPPKKKRTRRRKGQTPVQLSFAFSF